MNRMLVPHCTRQTNADSPEGSAPQRLLRYATPIVAAATLLAGCSGGGSNAAATPPVEFSPETLAPGIDKSNPHARSVSRAATWTSAKPPAASPYRIVWNFLGTGNGPHGAFPQAGLVGLDDVLYGTTVAGGAQGGGTIFSVTPAGTEKLLHNFSAIYSGSADGNEPQTDLIAVGTTLYGTTIWGGGSGCGGSGCGTVYKITPSGSETTLYRFNGGTDGNFPSALIEVNGALYGTTENGGGDNPNCNGGCGTVFKLTLGGTETIVYRFNGRDDGNLPLGLVGLAGTLYGTTDVGGTNGVGNAFKLSTSGQLTNLHNFGNGLDGYYPNQLIAVNGALYGTTSYGGSHCSNTGGCGTIYELTTAGNERVIYSFKGSPDAAGPEVGLTDVNGVLYGTTNIGGEYGAANGGNGYGTIYKVTTTGAESVVHSFGSSNDGSQPLADLADRGRILYGTTRYGGTYGYGTVFAFTP